MSSWNSHHLTEEVASDINCLTQTMQFKNPCPGNLTTVHTLAHALPASHMMTGGNDYPSDGGSISQRCFHL